MTTKINPVTEFEIAVNEHFKPLAKRLTLRFAGDDDCFVMIAADISVQIRFFKSHGGYDVVVGIAPLYQARRNPPDERGLGWFTEYLGFGTIPKDRIASPAEISGRVLELSGFTDQVLERVFASGDKFWPPFYYYVSAEIARMPEPEWLKSYKR